MRSLLLVESFYFRPSNQYILVGMIPSCFHFEKNVFVAGKSPVKVYFKILDIIILGELHIAYMGLGACFSSCSECYVIDLDSLAFILHFYKLYCLHLY
jgi:hypothetical protein